MRVSAFHSPYGVAYHVCSRCTVGNNIESYNKKSGTGGLPLCAECSRRITDGDC